MQELILFLLTYAFVFIIYQLFIVKRTKGKKKKNKLKKDPIEITYLEKVYHLDMKKVNYNSLLQVIAFVSSFDIALVVSLIMLFDNFIVEIIVGFISIVVLILGSYYLVYLFYKKKGMIKNDSK